MKKHTLVLMSVLLVCSCSSGNEETITNEKQNVSLTLGYTLVNSGSMTRNTYTDFYTKYIDSRKITPYSYSISFKNIENGDSLVVNGIWNNKDFFILREGTYEVKGISYPINSLKTGYAEYIAQDSVSLCFNEKINITKDVTNIILKANYDCFMLLFDNNNIEDVYLKQEMNPKVNAYKLGESFYMFIRDKKLIDEICTIHETPLYIKRRDSSISELWLNKFNMEKGKYYYFEDINGNYELSPMDKGY